MNDKYIDLIKDEYKESYLRYIKGEGGRGAWSSHQPVLIHVLNTITNGDVLEFGVGYHSTPIMHTICGEQKRKLLSIETNPEWLSKFKHYKNGCHNLEFAETVELINGEHHVFKKKFAIAFVDGAPANIRQPIIEKINADYIIVHDTEFVAAQIPDPLRYNYDFSMFKYVGHFRFFKTATSVLSNLDDINKEISDMLTS